MTLMESLRLLMANLAIANLFILSIALAASYIFRSLPKQHAALLAGIFASLLAPLLVILAWSWGLGQFPVAKSYVTAQPLPVQTENITSPPVSPDVNATPAIIEQAAAEALPPTTSPAKVAESSRITQKSSEEPQAPLAASTWPALTLHRGIDVLLLAWILGSAVVLLFQIRSYFLCQKLLRRCHPVHSTSIRQSLSDVAQHVGIAGEIRLLSANNLPAPAVVGIISPTVLIPEDAETQFTTSQLYGILVHELSHIARKDHWIMGLTNIVQVLYWWNPLLYRMKQRISETREMICDDIASQASAVSSEYAATIVGVAERSVLHASALASLGMGESSPTELEKRLKRILSHNSHSVEVRLSPLARFVTALLVLALCTTVLFAQVPRPSVSADPVTTPTVENTDNTRILRGKVISDDGKGVPDAYVVLPLFGKQIVLETHTDQDGRFELKIPPHKIRLLNIRSIWAYSKLYSLGSASPIRQVIDNSQEPLEIRLPPLANASFQILSPSGEPVRDALVSPWNYNTPLGSDIMPGTLRSLFADRTNAEGQVTLQGIDTQKLYKLNADHPLYGQQRMRMDWQASNASQATTKRMQLCQTGSIQGKLTGDPAYVGNVKVIISTLQDELIPTATGHAEVLTDKQGNFHIPTIAIGSIDANIRIEESWPVRPRAPQYARVKDGLPTSLAIKLEPTKKVHGVARGKKSQKPLSNLDISLRSGRLDYGVVTTDEHGKYEANVLPGPIEQQVVVSSIPGYSTHLSRWQDAVNVPDNTEDYELPVIELTETQELKGQLLSKQGQPLANKAVNAQKAFRTVGSGRTDKDGKFVMQIPEDLLAQLEFQVSDENFDGRKTAIEQKDPLVLRCTDDLEEQEAERLKRADVALTGRVILDDKPVAGVTVALHRSIPYTMEGTRGMQSRVIGTFVTDDKGFYKLTGLKAGDHYHVEILPYNSASPVFWQLIKSHPQIPIDTKGELELPDAFLIRLSQSLSGIAVDSEGKPLVGIHIVALDTNGDDLPWSVTTGQPFTATDSDGKFRLEKLPDIPLKVTAYRLGQPITRSLRYAAQKDAAKNQKDIRFVLDKNPEVPK